MSKLVLFFLLFLLAFPLFSQIRIKEKTLSPEGGTLTNGRNLNDTLNRQNKDEITVELDGKTHYTDYKIISFFKDTTIVDTTLTLQKERIFNYIRKNNFELLHLHNLGQTFNKLSYDFYQTNIFPEIGMKAKQFNFFRTEDVDYYSVPTPTSELFFQTGIQQGHVLNSLLTANINPRLNVSIAYKGLRSLGDYRNSLASHQNFRITASYTSKSNKYLLRTHYAGQNIMNQENGGLTDESILLYSTNNPEYRDRERLEANLTDAENRLKTKRYYVEHGYNLWFKPSDSLHKEDSYLQIGHEFTHKREFYTYKQFKDLAFFGNTYNAKVTDSTLFFRTENAAFIELKAPWILGKIKGKVNYNDYNYGYNSLLILNNNTIPMRIKGHNISLHAHWEARFKTFELLSEGGNVFEGDFKGNYLSGIATFSQDSLFVLKTTLLIKSQTPNLNFLLFQSNFVDYNWATSLQKEQTRFLGFSFLSKKLLDAEIEFTQKDFYTYFDNQSKPAQYTEGLAYLKAKAHKEVKWRKWALDNTLMYQKTLQGSHIFHVPDFVTENTFYFSDDVFKRKPMYLQTGITVKYFTQYYADEYNPVISEFILQNTTLIGNYPLIDYFINARVQRTRLFFKLENVGSLWNPGKYLSTPTQPFRDFNIRFGLVWNFFI